MYLENAISTHNKFWKYFIGSIIIVFASFIGQIPLGIAIVLKSIESKQGFPTDETKLMKMLSGNLSLFLMLFSFAVALLAIYLVVKYLHNQSFLTLTTSRTRVDWKRIFFSFGVWSIFTIMSVAISYFSEPENFVMNFKPMPFLILLVISIIMIPIQTSTEEYVFRGYLMQGFANLSMNKWFPLLMTSLIFGLLHIANPEVQKMGSITMVYYIGTGLLLGVMTLMDEGMELALGFHAANNLISALLITSDWTAFQTDSILKDKSTPSAGFEIILPVFIIFPLILLIFSKKYNWSNWKEKLLGKIEINSNIKIESDEHAKL